MIKQRVTKILAEMSKGIYERNRELGLALLSAVAGESIFLLGKPGVAKSLVARRLKMAFSDSHCFEYLMSRFSTPDEIFGPVKISQLKDNDTYERQTKGYLPEADVVFLDEIWKAGPAIQNSLLTIINEKIFHNGNKEIKVPMKALVSASNELPADGEGLDALWDRFLVRLVVDCIQDKTSFEKMISGSAVNEDVIISEPITADEFREWQHEIEEIAIHQNIFDVINSIRIQIAAYNSEKEEKEQIYISDRRWKKIVRLMKAAAFLNGNEQITTAQCWLIPDCLWNNTSQIKSVNEIVSNAIGGSGLPINEIKASLQAKIDEIESITKSQLYYTEKRTLPVFKTSFESKPIITDGEWLTLKIRLEELEKLRSSNVNEPVVIGGQIVSASIFSHKADVSLRAHMKDNKTIVITSIDFGCEHLVWPVAKQQGEIIANFTGTNYVRTSEETIDVEMFRAATSIQAEKWTKQIQKIEQKIDDGLNELAQFSEHELSDMSACLFVAPEKLAPLSETVRKNTDELKQMLVQLKRIRHNYANQELNQSLFEHE